MLEEKKIAVVVPVFNEESKIINVLETMPTCVDKVYVIDDCSTDKTPSLVSHYALSKDSRVELIIHPSNQGVGGAIATGYKKVIECGEDIAVVMAGDGQMDPVDFNDIVRPIIEDRADYSKGNRFLRGKNELAKIPNHRLFGNLVLSMLTKIVSGYWHVSDTQGGYTAINRKALEAVDWDSCYKRYGCPNDYLVKLNIAEMRVCDVPITAVYGENWQSKMKSRKVVFPILSLLLKLFITRVFMKYAVRDGHPIFFSYLFSFVGMFISIFLMFYIAIVFFNTGIIPKTASIFLGMSSILSIQLVLNSFEMDYKYNEWLFIHAK